MRKNTGIYLFVSFGTHRISSFLLFQSVVKKCIICYNTKLSPYPSYSTNFISIIRYDGDKNKKGKGGVNSSTSGSAGVLGATGEMGGANAAAAGGAGGGGEKGLCLMFVFQVFACFLVLRSIASAFLSMLPFPCT